MSWVVAIDESGNLGKESRYFCMAALIVRRPRYLRKAYDSIPKKGRESKFSNSSDEDIITVLNNVAEADVRVVYSIVDKYDHNGSFYGILGNDLYKAVLSALLDAVGSIVPNSDVNVLLDKCRFLTGKELCKIASSKMTVYGCQLKRCEKNKSDDSPCIQVIDFIVGAIGYKLNRNDDTFFKIIEKKVVVARTD